MNRKRISQVALSITSSLVAVLVSQLSALAQCAMCKNAITGSPDAGRLATNFNFAVLVLLIPPVLIFCGIFYAIFRYRRSHAADDSAASASRIEKSRGFSGPATSPKMKLG